MIIPRGKIDNGSISNATWLSKGHADAIVARAKTITEDPDRKERLEKQECPICFKGNRIGGQAITTKECDHCGTEMTFANTNTDRLCLACAKSLGVCKHCSADIDLKQRRKLWIKPKEPA